MIVSPTESIDKPKEITASTSKKRKIARITPATVSVPDMDAKSTLVEMAQQEDTLPTQEDGPEPKLQNEDDSLHTLSGQIILEA